ncbi:MAG: rod shape-determining protein RodA [Alphaproteobacteria bacterium]|nr:rod shape-determining protein RodA [Alphaproteobacteria bacterium]
MIKTPNNLHFLSFTQITVMTILVSCSFLELLSFSVGDVLCSKKILHTFLAYACFFIAAFSPLRIFFDKAHLLHMIICLALFISLFTTPTIGTHRWLKIGPFSLQISEFVKITMVLSLARYLASYATAEIKHFSNLIIPTAIVGIPSLLVLKQPDLGTALILVMSGLIVCYIAGMNKKFFFILLAAVTLSAPAVWHFVLHQYQRDRILTFIAPSAHLSSQSYQINQSRIAIGSGGAFGTGWRKGSQSQLLFLPEKHTDFIFSSWAEEFGFIGSILVIVLLLILISYGVRVSLVSRSYFGSYTSSGLIFSFALYTSVNIAMVCGFLPVVGVPLPFLSYGGSALISNFILMGIIASASRHRNTINL